MEFQNNTVIHGEDSEKPRINEESFNSDEVTSESQTLHVQQNGKLLVKCAQSSDVDVEETRNPSDIKSDPKQHTTCQDTGTIKGEDEIDIKEHGIPDEVSSESQTLHLQKNETHFMEYNLSRDVGTKVGIKPEDQVPNGVTTDIKCDPQQSHTVDLVTFLGLSTVKYNNALVLKVDDFNQDKIKPEPQNLHRKQTQTFFMEANESSNVITKVGVEQVALDANGVSSGIKCDPEQSLTTDLVPFLGLSTVKYNNALVLKVDDFNQDKITPEPQNLHRKQTQTFFMEANESSNVNTKVGVEQVALDANGVSSGIKCDPEQSPTTDLVQFLALSTVKYNNALVLKVDDFNEDEITPELQNLYRKQTQTFFMEANVSRNVNTKVGVEQVALDANGVSSGIKCDPEQSPTTDLVPVLGKGFIKTGDEMEVKENLQYCEETSALVSEREESGSKSNEAANDVPLESSRPYTLDSCSAIQYQESRNTSSLSTKPNTSTEKYETNHRCKTCGKRFKLLSYLKKHSLVAKGCKWRNGDKNCMHPGDFKDHLVLNNRNQYTSDSNGKRKSRLENTEVLLKDHDDKSLYKCPLCVKSFKDLPGLNSHHLVHDTKMQYKCQICDKIFKRCSDFKSHLLVHDDKRQYQCQICGHSFKQLRGLRAHLLVHADKRQYKCEICDKSFKQSSHLKTHLSVHADKRQFKCETCAKSFKRLADLKAHRLVHEDKRPYKCQICDKRFKQLHVLKLHLLVHADQRQYKCEICEKSFKQSSHLKQHLLVHDSKRQYKCEICEKTFKLSSNFKKHLLVHDEKRPYKCKVCEKSFKQLSGLNLHVVVHGDKRPYKCQICDKSFKHLCNLTKHHLLHVDKRKYKCHTCEKSFKLLSGLKSHLSVHDDKRHYNCKICGKSFKHLRSLKRHLLVHDDNSR